MVTYGDMCYVIVNKTFYFGSVYVLFENIQAL